MALNQTACYAGEFLLSKANGHISEETVTIAAAASALAAGTVLGKITASGKYVAYNNGANDGSEVAAGILYAPVPDSAADQKAVAIVRHAEVIGSKLTGSDANGVADLKALHIIVK